MNFDLFIDGVRSMVAGYVNASLPNLTETLLGRELLPAEVEPVEVAGLVSRWTALVTTALPDGRMYRVEYDCRTGAWSLTAYRREAARDE